MSLTALRNRSSKYVQVITSVAAVGMVVAAFSGLGINNYNNRNSVASQSPDDVVATVNGQPIKRAAFDQQLQKLMSGQPSGLFDYSRLNAQALDQATSDVLTVQIAKSKGLAVSNSDLDAARKAKISQIAVSLGMSPKASQSDVSDKLNENGASLDQYFNEDAEAHQLLMQKYVTFLRSANKVTADDAKQQYTDYHTQHIMVSKASRPDAEALAKANKIIQELASGSDFATLAKQDSDDRLSSAGGDDGWITKDTHDPIYAPEFLAAVKTLQKGQFTRQPVVSPQFGYYIIKLVDTRTNLPKDFDKNIVTEIEQLQNSRIDTGYEADLAKAKAAEKLVVKDDRLRLDHGMADLFQHPGSNGKLDQGELQKLINGYIELAKSDSKTDTKDLDQVAQIDADLGQLEGLVDEKDAKKKANLQIPYLVAALKAFGHADQQVDQDLAQLYQTVGDNANAVAALQAASSVTFANPQAHMQYASTFRSLGHADLAQTEMQLAAQEGQQTPPGGPQSIPMAINPSTAPGAHAVTVGGKPMPGGTVTMPAGMHPGGPVNLGSEMIHVGPGGVITPVGKGGITFKPGSPVMTTKPGAPVTMPVVMPHPPAPVVAPPPTLTKPSVLFNPPPKAPAPPPAAKPATPATSAPAPK